MIQFVCIMDDIGVVNIITILASHKLQQINKACFSSSFDLSASKISFQRSYLERKLRML